MPTARPRKPGASQPSGSRHDRRSGTRQPRRAQATRAIAHQRPAWQSPTLITSLSVAAIALVLTVVVLINQVGGAGNITAYTPLSATVADAVLHPDATVLNAVGAGGQTGNLLPVAGGTLLQDASGKPMVVYVGAEYCPFCAAERWSIAVALSRFGTFSNVREIESSSTDTRPDTHTLTFYKSTYTSSSIDFSSTEVQDRAGKALETMSPAISSIFTKYDVTPLTVLTGQFPFLDIGNKYVLNNTSFDPQILAGLTWDQIATRMQDPSDPVCKAIMGNANFIDAAICLASGDRSSAVATSPVIQAIEQTLASETPVAA
jgi:hypothetical protein